jgi:AcrR family transcriptional regulator
MKKADAPPRPRGRPRGFDRDEALEQAMRLFWSRGYEATSVADLTEAMGINPPTLYSFFGDKKRLFLETAELYQEGPGCFAVAALREEPTAERAIRRLLVEAADRFSAPDQPKGCMMVCAATNCRPESDDVYAALAEQRLGAEAAIRARIAAGRAAGELPPRTDIDALAGLIAATLFGLAVKARDGASRARLRKIAGEAMRAWPRRS